MTPDQIVSAVRAHLDRIDELAEGAAEPFLHGDRTGLKGLHPQILRHLYSHTPAQVLSRTAAVRQLLDLYEREANWRTYHGPALVPFTRGQDDGFRQGVEEAVKILAQGLGIDTEEKT